jgi:hypothetical protein
MPNRKSRRQAGKLAAVPAQKAPDLALSPKEVDTVRQLTNGLLTTKVAIADRAKAVVKLNAEIAQLSAQLDQQQANFQSRLGEFARAHGIDTDGPEAPPYQFNADTMSFVKVDQGTP